MAIDLGYEKECRPIACFPQLFLEIAIAYHPETSVYILTRAG